MVGATLLALEASFAQAASTAANEIIRDVEPGADRGALEAGIKAELWLALEDYAGKAHERALHDGQ